MINFRQEYEQAFAEFSNTCAGRAFELGRHALAILLKALDINPGDKVGVCSFTCLAVIEAVKVCGAIPVYLDIDEHLCIDPQEILIQDKGSLKAVILQHTFGNPGRFDELLRACEKIDAKIIEDCAHGPGCLWNGKKLGTFGEGAVGQGGMLTLNSKGLLEKADNLIERLAAYASDKTNHVLNFFMRAYQPLRESRFDCFLGYNYSRLRSMHIRGKSFIENGFPALEGYPRLASEEKAKAGLKKLENWEQTHQRHHQNIKMIEEYFKKAGLTLWPKRPEADITLMRYPLRVFNKWEIAHKAGMRGLDIASWYSSPVHPLNDSDLIKVNYHRGNCPRTEGTIERLVHLPTQSINEGKLRAMMRILNPQ